MIFSENLFLTFFHLMFIIDLKQNMSGVLAVSSRKLETTGSKLVEDSRSELEKGGNEQERQACFELLLLIFDKDDASMNLLTAYSYTDEELVNNLYSEVCKNPNHPLKNYILDYMKYLLETIQIKYNEVKDPLAFCKWVFPMNDVSCPETLKLGGFPTFEKSEDALKVVIEKFYFHWYKGLFTQSYVFRNSLEKTTPTNTGAIPKTIYFLKLYYLKTYYAYIFDILYYTGLKQRSLLKKPQDFCKHVLPTNGDDVELKSDIQPKVYEDYAGIEEAAKDKQYIDYAYGELLQKLLNSHNEIV